MSLKNNTKAAAAAIPVSTAGTKRERGTRYEATVDSIETTFYQTGSFGLKIKYVVQGLQKPVYENVVLKTVNNDGNLAETKYGADSLKRRLGACGLTADEINAIGIPNKKTTNDEFEPALGSAVAVYLAPRDYMGKQYYDVRSVWPLTNSNDNE